MDWKERVKWIIRHVATAPIVLYQYTLSPDHGPLKVYHPYGYCRFYPSCSEYCRQAIVKKGVVRGVALGLWRVLRCHPWSKGGVDAVR
ncbi:MAG: membrane protein insertion efficiency factor YidD [Patescibacteria group bacterium]|jgi:hypothetical protein